MGGIFIKIPIFKWSNVRVVTVLIVLFSSLIASEIFAQNKVIYEDVIQLITTEKIRGQIVDSIPGVSVNIRRHNQEVITIWSEDIYKILREPYEEDGLYKKMSSKPGVEFEDVILLNSAEVLRGKITSNLPGESITIQLHDNTSRTVARSEVSQILKERRKNNTPKTSADSTLSSQNEFAPNGGRVQGYINMGYGFDLGESKVNPIKFNFILAFGDEMTSVGLGLGVRFLPAIDEMVLPLFLDLRASPLPGRVSPFAGIGLGSTLQTAEGSDSFNGIMIHAQIGIEIAKTRNSGVMFSIGYEQFNVQTLVENPYFNGWFFLEPLVIKALTLNFGLRF